MRTPQNQLSSEMLARIIDGSPIPSFVINRQHIVTHWNTAIESLSGLKKNEIIGTDAQWTPFYNDKRPTLADLIVDGASADEIELFYRGKCEKSRLIAGAYEAEDYFPALNKLGKWLRFTASPIRANDGTILGAIETLEDVTGRKMAEENLRYYLKAITRAQEEERKRIARELHDGTTQVLGSISRQLDNFIRKKNALASSEILFLKDLQAQLNQGVKEVHRFSQELRLSVLDDFGLIPAIRSLLKHLQDSEGVNADLKVIGELRRCPPEVETMLFRLVQESVNNISKHAQASEASVTIEFAENSIRIIVSDNGKGFFLTESVDELPRHGKLGLAGIQERARLLGGTFEVRSTPGKGTSLIVELPGSIANKSPIP